MMKTAKRRFFITAPHFCLHARIQEFLSGGGGQGQSDKKALTFFLVLSLFFTAVMVNFKEIYHFSSPEGDQHFPGGGGGGGGVQIFPGGGGPIAYSL